MSKAFVRESEDSGEQEQASLQGATSGPPPGRNYITPSGFARMKAELRQLVEFERPELVRTVSWAAANGDRSENGDYLYGKKRLREIDRRVRLLIKRLENAEVVHSAGRDSDQVFFGATVALRSAAHGERTVTIVGADEAEPSRGRVSWHSPMARALLKARGGERVLLRSPAGDEELEILQVRYDPVE